MGANPAISANGRDARLYPCKTMDMDVAILQAMMVRVFEIDVDDAVTEENFRQQSSRVNNGKDKTEN